MSTPTSSLSPIVTRRPPGCPVNAAQCGDTGSRSSPLAPGDPARCPTRRRRGPGSRPRRACETGGSLLIRYVRRAGEPGAPRCRRKYPLNRLSPAVRLHRNPVAAARVKAGSLASIDPDTGAGDVATSHASYVPRDRPTIRMALPRVRVIFVCNTNGLAPSATSIPSLAVSEISHPPWWRARFR